MPSDRSLRGIDPSPKLSAIVLSYRNEDTVLDSVGSLVAQPATEPFEVIVVASGGGPCAELVRERYPSVRVIGSGARLLPGAARNAGVEVARGDVIAFLAADCLAEPGWIEGRIRAHARGHDVVASSVTNAGPFTSWAWAFYFFLYCNRMDTQTARDLSRVEPAAHGLSYDADRLRELGPFSDSRIGEDTDMAHRVIRAGGTIWLEPGIRSAHIGPPSAREMLSDLRSRGARRAVHESHAGRGSGLRRGVYFCKLAVRRVRQTLSAIGADERHRPRLLEIGPWVVVASLVYHWGWWRQEQATGFSGGAHETAHTSR